MTSYGCVTGSDGHLELSPQRHNGHVSGRHRRPHRGANVMGPERERGEGREAWVAGPREKKITKNGFRKERVEVKTKDKKEDKDRKGKEDGVW